MDHRSVPCRKCRKLTQIITTTKTTTTTTNTMLQSGHICNIVAIFGSHIFKLLQIDRQQKRTEDIETKHIDTYIYTYRQTDCFPLTHIKKMFGHSIYYLINCVIILLLGSLLSFTFTPSFPLFISPSRTLECRLLHQTHTHT